MLPAGICHFAAFVTSSVKKYPPGSIAKGLGLNNSIQSEASPSSSQSTPSRVGSAENSLISGGRTELPTYTVIRAEAGPKPLLPMIS